MIINHDQNERLQALNPTQSFIVQAPAGSGKTELLIQRMLTLLAQVKKPEEIFAITFTKKAANEMRARVLKALSQAAHSPEPQTEHAKLTWRLANNVLEQDKKHQWNLLSNPNQLRIQTIDSLCTFLTSQLPLLSQFGSQPEIVENPSALYQQAVQEVLNHVEYDYEWSESLSSLLLHLDNDLNKLHDLFINLLRKRDQWLHHIQFDTNDQAIRNYLEQQLHYIISEHLDYLHSLIPPSIAPEIIKLCRYAAKNLAATQITNSITACLNIEKLPGTQYQERFKWQGIAELLITKSYSWRKRVDASIGFVSLQTLKNPLEKKQHSEFRTCFTNLIEQLNVNNSLREALQDLGMLPNSHYEPEQWKILQDLIHVLKIIAAQLRLTFQQHGQIDFIENAQAALVALGDSEEPTDLALALDYRIQHILIDEFQDTSYSQYQLLEKLTMGWQEDDGRTLFVVGDPMQSIYRFREAEVGLFIQLRNKGIGSLQLIPITLTVNFRSLPSVIEWNNQHFSKIFPNSIDIRKGAITYSSSTAPTGSNAIAATIREIGCSASSTAGNQGEAIVSVIKNQLDEYPSESIALLVRSRSHLRDLIPAIKHAGIPYQAIDIDPLITRPFIQDLLALTCALLHPADKISWLAILRAPWCGLSLADLLEITKNNSSACLWSAIANKTTATKLSADGQIRLTKFRRLIHNTLLNRQRLDLRTWIESTWLLLGGPATLHDLSEMQDVAVFFNLLQTYSHEDPNLQIHTLRNKLNHLYASAEQNAPLQIMTIHSAKGLEFDTVIIPHLEKRMPNDDKGLLAWTEQPLNNNRMALLLAPINAVGELDEATYHYIRRTQKNKLHFESDRLLYVATTRAKKNLFFTYDIPDSTIEDFKPETGSFLEKLWPFFRNSYAESAVSENSISEPLIPPVNKLKRFPIDWRNPISFDEEAIKSLHQQETGFMLANHKPRIMGTILHAILQQLSQSGIQWWTNQSVSQQKKYFYHQFRRHGLTDQESLPWIAKAQDIIKTAIQDQKCQWILQPHPAAKSELKISAYIDNKLTNLIIDRTFIDENGVRWIIDYKTTTLNQADLTTFLATERDKHLIQLQRYKNAWQLNEECEIKLGLYFPALPYWIELES